MRYEIQTHLNDRGNIGPRMGVTWAPFKSGRTTLRGSFGLFYNWLNANTYEQTLRVDGLRQRDLFIVNPSYPDPGVRRHDHHGQPLPARTGRADGPHPACQRRHRSDPESEDPPQRVVPERARRSTSCAAGTSTSPSTACRPDPAFANIIQTVSDAEAHSDQLSATMNVNFAGGVRNAGTPRWNLRRTTLRLVYWIARANNNFDGPFVVPPSGALDTEWAPAPGDRRHRYQVALNTQALKNLNASVTLGGNTGTPYNITTGFDTNNDSIFNDRPAGVGRNSARTTSQATVSGTLSYSLALAARAGAARGRSQERQGAAATAAAGDRPLPPGLPAVGEQPDQSPELLRLQRHPDVPLLPDADLGPEPAKGGPRRQPPVLAAASDSVQRSRSAGLTLPGRPQVAPPQAGTPSKVT